MNSTRGTDAAKKNDLAQSPAPASQRLMEPFTLGAIRAVVESFRGQPREQVSVEIRALAWVIELYGQQVREADALVLENQQLRGEADRNSDVAAACISWVDEIGRFTAKLAREQAERRIA